MVATGPAQFVAGQAPEQGSERNVDSLKQVCDLLLTSPLGEGYAVQSRYLGEAGAKEVAKYCFGCGADGQKRSLYDVCRGLEGWAVVYLSIDRFFD